MIAVVPAHYHYICVHFVQWLELLQFALIYLPSWATYVLWKHGITRRIYCCASCCCGASRAAIDQYLLPVGPTAANLQQRRTAGKWDRQTDIFYRFIHPASHTVPAAPIIEILRHRHVIITQNINKWADDCNCKPVHLHWEQFVTRSSAIAEGPRDAPWQ